MDVVASDRDQLMVSLSNVDVPREPVHSQTADVPRGQELHQGRRLPAECVDDRLSSDRPRVGLGRVGRRLGPVDDAGHSVVVDVTAAELARLGVDERQLGDRSIQPAGRAAGDPRETPPDVRPLRPEHRRQRQ